MTRNRLLVLVLREGRFVASVKFGRHFGRGCAQPSAECRRHRSRGNRDPTGRVTNVSPEAAVVRQVGALASAQKHSSRWNLTRPRRHCSATLHSGDRWPGHELPVPRIQIAEFSHVGPRDELAAQSASGVAGAPTIERFPSHSTLKSRRRQPWTECGAGTKWEHQPRHLRVPKRRNLQKFLEITA